uniref:Phytanoyl-CoA dioxygenase n=1 Tax=Chrysotila carterae TaxID=13221 RepID=A0A7S4EZ28_CHRCT
MDPAIEASTASLPHENEMEPGTYGDLSAAGLQDDLCDTFASFKKPPPEFVGMEHQHEFQHNHQTKLCNGTIDDRTQSELDVPPSPSPHVVPLEPPAFAVGDEAMSAHLRAEGFALVRAALPAEALDGLRDQLWQFLEESTPMRRGVPQSWQDRCFPGPAHLGMLSWAGIGQSPFMWSARCSAGVVRSFEVAWNLPPRSGLLTSFDGAAFFRPPQIERSWATQPAINWLHCDQGRVKAGLTGIQGALLLYDQDASSGGLVVYPRSHLRHAQTTAHVPPDEATHDFVSIAPHHPALDGLGNPRLICGRAGDLVLWDSRTVHASEPALASSSLPVEADGAPRPARVAAYISMIPAAAALAAWPQLAEIRHRAVTDWITTTHWPKEHRAVSQGAQPQRLNLDELPPLARSLIYGSDRHEGVDVDVTAPCQLGGARACGEDCGHAVDDFASGDSAGAGSSALERGGHPPHGADDDVDIGADAQSYGDADNCESYGVGVEVDMAEGDCDETEGCTDTKSDLDASSGVCNDYPSVSLDLLQREVDMGEGDADTIDDNTHEPRWSFAPANQRG